MTKLPLMLTVALATVLISPALSLGEETAPPRTPWAKTDPGSSPVVRWVFEGCAAYPITEETIPGQPAESKMAAAEDPANDAVSLTEDP